MRSIREILQQSKTIAVVGLSPNAERPSFRVSQYMQQQGYRIIPVNPHFSEVLGEKAYPDLGSVPHKIDIVNIFRRPEDVPPVVNEAIAVGAKTVWMQLGIVHEEAGEQARSHRLDVVMDRCILVEHRGLLRQGLL
ncbi:MAG: CoA-binding protein [Chloroflexi bacterium]|nr:CoA-binding protein [Chloroflexota bacterium]